MKEARISANFPAIGMKPLFLSHHVYTYVGSRLACSRLYFVSVHDTPDSDPA